MRFRPVVEWDTAQKVVDEYVMTKGHFHAVLEMAEVYHVLQGEGLITLFVYPGHSSHDCGVIAS